MQPLTRGSRLGPYLLLEPLGSGGHASVWLADPLGGAPREPVALKVLHAESSDDKMRARFAGEAAALRLLEAPGIVRILDAGHDRDVEYLAMEYLPRGSLARWAGMTPIPAQVTSDAPTARVDLAALRVPRPRSPEQVKLVVEWFLSAAHGLALAHANGILHRDLKPSNILIRDDSTACLADFGVAIAEGAPRLTTTAGVIGTLAYMAPEQIQGEVATPRSDIFGLCATFAEVVSGWESALPHTPIGGADPARIWATRFERVHLDGLLGDILLRGLRRDPMERYPNVSLLIADLESYRRGTLEAAWRPNFTTRIALMLRRRRRVIVAGVVLALVVSSAAWYGVAAGSSSARLEARASDGLVQLGEAAMGNPLRPSRESLAHFEAALRRNGANLRALRPLVDAEIESGEPGRAARRLLEFERTNGELPRADRWNLVRALRLANDPSLPDPEPRLAALRSTASAEPDWSESVAMAHFHLALGFDTKAAEVLKIPAPPSQEGLAMVLRAHVLTRTGDESEAILQYASWLRSEASRDWQSMLSCARLMSRRRDHDDADRMLARAKRVPGADPYELELTAAILLNRKERSSSAGIAAAKAMIARYETAGVAAPAHFRLDLAGMLLERKMHGEAIRILEAMPPRQRMTRMWRRCYANVLSWCVHDRKADPSSITNELGYPATQATTRALECLDRRSDAPVSELVFTARSLLQLQRGEELADVAARLELLPQKTAAVHEVLHYVYAGLRQDAKAFAAAVEAHRCRPSDEGFLERILQTGAMVLQAQQKLLQPTADALEAELIQYAKQLLELPQRRSASSYGAYLAVAATVKSTEFQTSALLVAPIAAEFHPNSGQILGNWAALLLTKDRDEEAYEKAARARQLLPKSSEALGILFECALRTGRHDELPLLASIWKRLPEPPRPGRYDRATAVRRALEDPRCPEAVKERLRR